MGGEGRGQEMGGVGSGRGREWEVYLTHDDYMYMTILQMWLLELALQIMTTVLNPSSTH